MNAISTTSPIEPDHASSKRSISPLAWISVAVLALVPALILWLRPAELTPFSGFVLNVLLMAIPLVLDNARREAQSRTVIRNARDEAVRTVEDRWLPQAESATDRLMTIRSEAAVLKRSLTCECAGVKDQLPALDEDVQRQIMTIFDGHCRACIAPVSSVVNHLDSAIGDWKRFIQHSCHGNQCAEIFRTLDSRQKALDAEALASNRVAGANPHGCGQEIESKDSKPAPAQAQ